MLCLGLQCLLAVAESWQPAFASSGILLSAGARERRSPLAHVETDTCKGRRNDIAIHLCMMIVTANTVLLTALIRAVCDPALKCCLLCSNSDTGPVAAARTTWP